MERRASTNSLPTCWKVGKPHLVAFSFQPILNALKEHLEGVPPVFFKKEECEGIDLSNPVAVGDGMKTA